MTIRPRVHSLALASCLVAALLTPVYSAYKGHANDQDVNAVLAAYPALKGAPADSCATCHRRGAVPDAAVAGRLRDENHCDYCHALVVRDKGDVKATLNAYGLDYLAAGRNLAAVRALAGKDADGDGFANEAEFEAGTDPGDRGSNPSVRLAPAKRYSIAALRRMVPLLDTTVFLSSTKSKAGDSYSDYRGAAVWAVLQAVGVAATVEGVDLISADGYERTFTVEELRKAWPQAAPVMGLGRADLGACGWVTYGSQRVKAGQPLPSTPVMLAFEENGQPFQPARFDPATGRLVGKGPVRAIAPQFKLSPPDLPQFAEADCPGKVAAEHRFHDDYDHNAGASGGAIVAVRVKPLPKGTRDIDWQSAAAGALTRGEIVFFGALEPR